MRGGARRARARGDRLQRANGEAVGRAAAAGESGVVRAALLAGHDAAAAAVVEVVEMIRHHDALFVTRVGEGSNFAPEGLIVRPLCQA